MYSTEDTHHFPAYGVAPDYWAQRALGANHHGKPLALAPHFAVERLLASESVLREREQATAQAERRNASREKQLSDHTIKLEEHRASNPNPNPNPNPSPSPSPSPSPKPNPYPKRTQRASMSARDRCAPAWPPAWHRWLGLGVGLGLGCG